MTKHIVKNCPAYIINGQCAMNGEHDSPFEPVPCKDRTDCPIKQVVDECKRIIEDNACINCKDKDIECWQCENEYRYRSGLPELELPKQILQTLQVEEVE